MALIATIISIIGIVLCVVDVTTSPTPAGLPRTAARATPLVTALAYSLTPTCDTDVGIESDTDANSIPSFNSTAVVDKLIFTAMNQGSYHFLPQGAFSKCTGSLGELVRIYQYRTDWKTG